MSKLTKSIENRSGGSGVEVVVVNTALCFYAALANTNMPSFTMAVSLALTYYWGHTGRCRIFSVAAGLIMLAGFAAVIYQKPNLIQSFIRYAPSPDALVEKLGEIFFERKIGKTFVFIGATIATAVLLWRIRKNGRLIVIGLLTLTPWIASPFVEMMVSKDRFGGFLLMLILFLLWQNEAGTHPPSGKLATGSDAYARPKRLKAFFQPCGELRGACSLSWSD